MLERQLHADARGRINVVAEARDVTVAALFVERDRRGRPITGFQPDDRCRGIPRLVLDRSKQPAGNAGAAGTVVDEEPLQLGEFTARDEGGHAERGTVPTSDPYGDAWVLEFGDIEQKALVDGLDAEREFFAGDQHGLDVRLPGRFDLDLDPTSLVHPISPK